VLDSDDLRMTRGCMSRMGAGIAEEGGSLVVDGVAGKPAGGTPHDPAVLEVHESGTTCRLVTGIAGAGQGAFRVQGAPRMHERPIAELAETLQNQGVDVKWLGTTGCPPLLLETTGLAGGDMAITMEESSQYLSGLLLAAPMAAKSSTIAVTGSKIVSWPYVALTLQVMHDFGVPVRVEKLVGDAWAEADWRDPGKVEPKRLRFRVDPGAYRAREYSVEGDWSNASYFLAAGALGGPVTVHGLRRDSVQGDRAIADILAAMGADVRWEDDALTVSGGDLHGVELDMRTSPDIVPTVAVTAAQATGPTTIRGVAHLRIKECDRLDATATEINRAGGKVEVLDDGLRIEPVPLKAGQRVDFTTYGDHRIAMSMSLLELAGVDVHFDNPGCVSKSFPGFWDQWKLIREGVAR
jgi:3-phosphoshikimate 1-carboxyvinyltransferase